MSTFAFVFLLFAVGRKNCVTIVRRSAKMYGIAAFLGFIAMCIWADVLSDLGSDFSGATWV